MGTTLETLEIQFRANTGALHAQLSALTAQLALTDLAARQTEVAFAAMGGRMIQVAQEVAAGLGSGVAAARSAGRSTGAGYAGGILDALPSVKNAARTLANAAQSIIRSALKIHSPSKVTRELGAFAGEGFSLGVKDELSAVRAQAAALAGAAEGGFSAAEPVVAGAAVNRGIMAQAQTETGLRGDAVMQVVQAAVRTAMDSLEITVPLNVDGVKLGEASIRGINAVTKRTGRLQLNI